MAKPAAKEAKPKAAPAPKPAPKPKPKVNEAYAAAKGDELNASVCADGIATARFEQLSAERYGTLQRMKKATEEAQKQAAAAKLSPKATAAAIGDAQAVAARVVPTAAEKASTLTAWRSAVTDSLQNASVGDTYMKSGKTVFALDKAQAGELHAVADAFSGKTKGVNAWTSAGELDSLLDGKVPGLGSFAGNGAGYRQHKRPMWSYLARRGLAYEGDWQKETATSWVNKKKEVTYADPTQEAYIVSSKAKGTFAKVTAPNGNSIYVRVLESGTNIAEASLLAWQKLGYPDVNPRGAPTEKLKVQFLPDSGGMGASTNGSYSYEHSHLSYDEIQRSGALIEQGKLSKVRTRNDLLRAENKVREAKGEPPVPLDDESDLDPPKPKPKADDGAAKKKSSSKKKKVAGLRLLQGFPTVAIGPTMRLVGYACEDCLHEGGGYIKEGSSTVYVGKYPFARVGDGTSDDLGVVSGADTVFIGGAPTSAQLA